MEKFTENQMLILQKAQENVAQALRIYRQLQANKEHMAKNKNLRVDYVNGENSIVQCMQMLQTIKSKNEA